MNYLPLQKLQGDWAPAFNTKLSGIVWVISVSCDFCRFAKATINQSGPKAGARSLQSSWSSKLTCMSSLCSHWKIPCWIIYSPCMELLMQLSLRYTSIDVFLNHYLKKKVNKMIRKGQEMIHWKWYLQVLSGL